MQPALDELLSDRPSIAPSSASSSYEGQAAGAGRGFTAIEARIAKIRAHVAADLGGGGRGAGVCQLEGERAP